MIKVPITRLKRERKWLRDFQCIEITQRGKTVAVLLDVDTYNLLISPLSTIG